MAATTIVRRHIPLAPSAAPDERAARATLREQIARLEQRLSGANWELWNARVLEPIAHPSSDRPQARLLTLAELEATRDALVEQAHSAERLLEQHADAQAQARARLEAMLADPAAHRYEVVQRAELGEPSCGAYHVLPRLGLVGMLFGWWCVKLSSGCPLPMPYPQRYHSRKPRKPWGRNAKLELTITIIVIVAVIAAILVFLLVYHDFPLRLGEPT